MLFLAIRHLFSRKRQTFLILFGIGLGSMIYVVIAGIQLGLRSFMIEQLINNDAQIRISASERPITPQAISQIFWNQEQTLVNWITPPSGRRDDPFIEHPVGWFEFLDQHPDVLAYSPQLSTQAILTHGTVKAGAKIVGVIPERHRRVTTLEKYMKEGDLTLLEGGSGKVILGKGLMQILGLRVSDTVSISTGTGERRPFKVVGSFELGVPQLDDTLVYGPLQDIQRLNKTPGKIQSIAVSLMNVDLAQEMAQQWAKRTEEKVESWDKANANYLQLFNIQDIVRGTITVAILVVAGFGIYNVLSIQISQKRREIAILRAVGFSPKQILSLFLSQGLMLGISGGVLGLVLGLGLCRYLEGLDIAILGGQGFIISYQPSIYVTAMFMALSSSLLASFLPAHSASRLTPIEIIRSEV